MDASLHRSSFTATAASSSRCPEEVSASLEKKLRHCSPAFVLFFASPRYDIPARAAAIDSRFPDAITAGCSTMGEIGPAGLTQGAVSALAVGSPCRAAAVLISRLTDFRFEEGGMLLAELGKQLGRSTSELAPGRHVLVTLTDGMSGLEEILVASLGHHLPAVPLVGGSAGDDFQLRETLVALNGETSSCGAVVVLLEPSVAFMPFHLHHYVPTAGRLVVTSAEPRKRLVRRLNGLPAPVALARLLGIHKSELMANTPEVLGDGDLQLGFRVGDEYYIRSVMTVEEDCLRMGGALEEGAILTVMKAGDLVAETRAGVLRALDDLQAEPAAMLLFNCGGRLWEARAKGVLEEFERAMCPVDCAGFTTYGEQFGALQVNHTLTGLVLGKADGDG